MDINSSYNIYSMYNTMFHGSMSIFSNRLNRNIFPKNKAQGTQSLAMSSLQYINTIKAASKDIGSALKELSGAAFSNRTMTSSNPESMTVSYSGNRPNSTDPMTVKIDQTAAGQMNEGARMTGAAAYEGDKGTNKFSITVGGKSTELSVNVAASDTNKNVQQKMADAINKAGVGIKATVETDSATNSSMLRLESTTTGSGTKSSFTVTDVTGDLTARTGASDVAMEGRDAVYSVNGGPARTSQSNTVNLGNGISATFIKASDETLKIARGKDMNYAMSTVENLVKSYNDLYAESVTRTNDPKSQNLASKMLNVSKTYSKSLSDIGIGFDNDGRMTIDKQKLAKAAESGKLEQFFKENSGKSFGFTNQIGRLADNVSRNTSNYVSSSLFGSNLGENFAYSSFGDLIQYNYLSVGSIFDYLF